MLGTGCVAESLQQRSSSSNIGSRSGSAVCISYSLVLVVVVVTVVVVANIVKFDINANILCKVFAIQVAEPHRIRHALRQASLHLQGRVRKVRADRVSARRKCTSA